MDILKTIIIGIIQGITEWLPVSSTGHMILAEEFLKLNVSEAFWEMFLVVIQFGSILAVLALYFHKLNPLSPKKSDAEKRQTWLLWVKVIVAVIPAAIIGLFFDDILDELFYNPLTVSIALIVYGIAFIIIERRKRAPSTESLEALSFRRALGIGAFQLLALIPGTSRSGSTILGAMLLGTARPVAAEFSFFLAIPVMFGASLLKIVKYIAEVGFSFAKNELIVLAVGLVTAFIVSVFAIKLLMGYVRKHDFKVFGIYRIILGIIVIAYFLIFK